MARKLTLRPEVVKLLSTTEPAFATGQESTLGTSAPLAPTTITGEEPVAKRRTGLGVPLEIPTSLEPIAPAQSIVTEEPLPAKLAQRPEVTALLGITPKKTFTSSEQDIADAARINEQRRRALISLQNRLIRTSTLGATSGQTLGGLRLLTGV